MPCFGNGRNLRERERRCGQLKREQTRQKEQIRLKEQPQQKEQERKQGQPQQKERERKQGQPQQIRRKQQAQQLQPVRSGYNRRRVGAGYEKSAGAYLESRGFRILTYNFRCARGEIDIISLEGEVLVFTEVKYRRNALAGNPLEAVDRRKQGRICRCADYYRVRYPFMAGRSCRFDVIGILGDEIRLVRDAFSYIPAGR